MLHVLNCHNKKWFGRHMTTNMYAAGALYILALFNLVQAARILCIYPVPYISHQVVLRRLTQELANQGHQLVVMTPLPHDKAIENVTEIDVYDVSFPFLDKSMENVLTRPTTTDDLRTFWSHVFYNIISAQLNSPGMQALLHDESQVFDLIITQACLPSGLLVGARFQAPVTLVTVMSASSKNFEHVGAEVNPIYFPDYTIRNKIWKPFFFDKIKLVLDNFLNSMNIIFLGKDVLSTIAEQKNNKILFVNVHPIWDNNRPVPPGVIFLEDINNIKPSALPRDLDTYLNNSAHGVIYMSLGSKLRPSLLPSSTIQLIFRVFASLPYDILWKWDGEDLISKPKNIRFEKRLPQKDLLYHSKIKAIITHCGLLSTEEAIAAEVPLIGLPILSDQWRNSHQQVKFGIGVKLNLYQLNEEEFRKAIIDVAENKGYRENIKRLSRAMRDRRGRGALPNAARALVHLTLHGAGMLHPPLPDVTLIEFYLLDLIAVATFISVTLIAMSVFALRRAIRWLQVKNKDKKL